MFSYPQPIRVVNDVDTGFNDGGSRTGACPVASWSCSKPFSIAVNLTALRAFVSSILQPRLWRFGGITICWAAVQLCYKQHRRNPVEEYMQQKIMQRKILVMGLPGAGKTTLANALAPLLNAVVFNADAVRTNLSRDLGYSHQDRVEHARRMGWMCDRVVEAGGTVIADFICPTADTRAAFGEAFTIWVDRIEFRPLRRHQPDVRGTGALRSARQGGGRATVLGGRGAGAAAAGVRSAEADCAFHRSLSTVPWWSPTPDRRGYAASSDRSVSRYAIPMALTRKIRCRSSRSSSASRLRCLPMPGGSWWCRCRISPTSSMAVTSVTTSSALCSMRRPRRSPPARCAR